MHTNTTGGPHDHPHMPPAPELLPGFDALLDEADQIAAVYRETADRLNDDVLNKRPLADAEAAARYWAYVSAMEVMASQLRTRAGEITRKERQ